MKKKTLENYPFLVKLIEQWSVRMRRARLTQKQVAIEAEISETILSQIINCHSDNPRLATIQKVENILEKHGV